MFAEYTLDKNKVEYNKKTIILENIKQNKRVGR